MSQFRLLLLFCFTHCGVLSGAFCVLSFLVGPSAAATVEEGPSAAARKKSLGSRPPIRPRRKPLLGATAWVVTHQPILARNENSACFCLDGLHFLFSTCVLLPGIRSDARQ
eukprot:s7284_g3.t1